MREDKPDAWMPLYVGDWDSDTRHLDCEQDGAYGRLVRHYWRNGPLPDDDAMLARIVGMELKRWRKVRTVLAPFFVIEGGQWRHHRVEAELAKWTQRRAKAIERARAGGRAKAAKSSASSTRQALLSGCTSSSSEEVDAPSGQSTLFEPPLGFQPPADVWRAFVRHMGVAWATSWIRDCGWQDLPDRALIAPHGLGAARIKESAGHVLRELGITVLEKAA
jgi:uncharacterized protein YdaU (DUF1376 family)